MNNESLSKQIFDEMARLYSAFTIPRIMIDTRTGQATNLPPSWTDETAQAAYLALLEAAQHLKRTTQ